MPSQSELGVAKQFMFFEDPDEGGQLRTKNFPPTQCQRQVITNRVKGTPFKADVQLVSCVHGKMSDSEPTPASLVVVGYHLGCVKGEYRCKSVETTLEFKSYGSENSHNRPMIRFYEPFRQHAKYERTEVEHTKKGKAEGSLGATFTPADAGLTLGRETEEKYKSSYHATGEAWPYYPQDGIPEPSAVEWQFSQNEKSKTGMPNFFRVAVLIQRKNSDKFKCTFTLNQKAGGRFTAINLFRKVFIRTTDDPIIFDPSLEPQGEATDIDASSLGEYMEPGKLLRLTAIHHDE